MPKERISLRTESGIPIVFIVGELNRFWIGNAEEPEFFEEITFDGTSAGITRAKD